MKGEPLVNIDKMENLDQLHAYGSNSGSRQKALTNTIKGFNTGHTGLTYVQPNQERQGYVFFVRPQLNLSRKNCLRVRQLYRLLTESPNTVQAYIRATLDPSLYTRDEENCRTELVDNDNPFIPILTNCCMSVSGWPDLVAPTYTSPEGMRKEAWSVIDGVMESYEAYDLDCTFFNMQDEPISQLIYTWIKYATLIFEGRCHRYPSYIAYDVIDYNTRIYRIITDKTDTFVSKAACTGISYPISIPTGDFANYKNDEVLNTNAKELTIRFRSLGACYYDDIVMQEFNETVRQFNHKLDEEITRRTLGTSSSSFFKIPPSYSPFFSFHAIPLIDMQTLEFCWYLDLTTTEGAALYDEFKKHYPEAAARPTRVGNKISERIMADVNGEIANKIRNGEVYA